ncbi:MAG: hypothetical protein V3R99_05500, partial [Thermoguttaceae bacterium]
MPDPFDPYHRWLGIPSDEQPPNHYRLLAICPFEDDPAVIENAADQRMAHLRSVQSGRHGVLSQELLNQVAAANLCLLNPEKKAAYDRQLRQRLQAASTDAARIPAAAPAVPIAPGGAVDLDVQDPTGTSSQAAAERSRQSRRKLGLIVGAATAAVLIVVGWLVWAGISGDETAEVEPANEGVSEQVAAQHIQQQAPPSPDVPTTEDPSPPSAEVPQPSPPETEDPAVAVTDPSEDVTPQSPETTESPSVADTSPPAAEPDPEPDVEPE